LKEQQQLQWITNQRKLRDQRIALAAAKKDQFQASMNKSTSLVIGNASMGNF
jgi:hypothetical protein